MTFVVDNIELFQTLTLIKSAQGTNMGITGKFIASEYIEEV
jgi:hypothetical protein